MSTPAASRAVASLPPSLADVLVAIAAADLPARRRQDLASAVRSIARALDRPPEQVPADPRLLASRLGELAPLALGFSKGRWNNLRSLLRAALELVTAMAPGRHLAPLSPAWQALWDRLPSRALKTRLSRLLHYCSGAGIEPDDVTEATFAAFRAHLALTLLKEPPVGRALQGKIPGGHAFGYDVVGHRSKGAGGERTINPAEAAVVVDIFTAFANGESPRAIAKRLNAAAVPGPGGRAWRDTTIRGQVDRGTGLLNNAIYIGRLEWNRCSYVKDPRTGRRVARVNARQQWEIVEVPELRIVDDDLWQRVRERQQMVRIEIGRDQTGNALNRAHRRRFLFSGLLVCGLCGGGYTIVAPDRYGCASRRSKGTCSNSHTILRPEIEARVLAGLKERLLAPELFREFAQTVQRELAARSHDADRERLRLERERSATRRKIEAMLKAIEDGFYTSSMKERMTALEAQTLVIQSRLDQLGTAPPVRLHPNLAALYAEKVAKLADALNTPDTRNEAGEIIRSLIDRVVLTPEGERLKAELYGDLAGILALCDGAKGERGASAGVVSVVAGTGFEPATFRL